MTRARDQHLRRRARRVAIRAVRRSRLFPSTLPDRLGDDDRLAEESLSQQVMVYFADTRESLYQLRQWYAPLRALDARHPVIGVFQDSRTAAIVREELGLPVITIARYGSLDGLLSRSDIKLALYVNHTPQNFSALRFTSLVHVYLAHGDSDKGVSISNQCKAYDFNFVAGQAAIDRLSDYLMFTDPATWCITIGRPQLDGAPVGTAGSLRPDRPTVLYAPTWEGAQPSLAYGSLASHGAGLVGALIDSARFSVAYRPHPLAGVTDAAYGAADAAVRSLISAAAEDDPAAGHRVEVDRPLEASFAAADLMLCDVSAVAMDWLPSGKPLVITVPAAPEVVTPATRMLEVVPRLAAADLDGVVELVAAQITADPQRADRLALVDYYLGDTSPGAATQRFLEACTEVIQRRDEQRARVLSRGPAGP